MNANLFTSTLHNRPRQMQALAPEVIVRTSLPAYAAQMERTHQLAYGYTPGERGVEDFTADHFRQHHAIYPDGQFIALDQALDRVVGFSVNMRVDYDPLRPSLKSWVETTAYG